MEQPVAFSSLDRHFARFMTSLSGQDTPELYYASALLSNHVAQGHVCIDLSAWERRPVIAPGEHSGDFTAPSLGAWQRMLLKSAVVGVPGDFKPLILDHRSRLYLYRYWEYEQDLAQRIRRLAFNPSGPTAPGPGKQSIARLFPEASAQKPDWQRIAALIACFNPFLVISGSPGTGKTSTVARILALILEQRPSVKLRIALAAPTGKAAARLQEAIRTARDTLDCDPVIRSCIPEKASTVHRLLGSLPHSPYFRHHENNPLPADIIVVDEASMLDLPLLSKLVQAMPEKASLILLGDKNQLASVEAGAVLGDLCGDSPSSLFSREIISKIMPYGDEGLLKQVKLAEAQGLHDSIVELRKNYRFSVRSDIGKVCASVNRGQGSRLLESLGTDAFQDVRWSPLPKHLAFEKMLQPVALDGYGAYLDLIQAAGAWDDIFDTFDRFRILCALRQGPFGVTAVNQLIESLLASRRLISGDGAFYCGQPVMITRNNPQLGLYNGDVGLILADPGKDGQLSAVFRDSPGHFRQLSPRRLPEYETVYAMTVHKSQGSEFDQVLLILSDTDSPVLTRELVYTGVTRARKQVLIWSAEDIFISSISRRIRRVSGLRDALWQNAG